MTRDDIIRMSQASGVLMTTPSGVQIWCPDELERFAALVAAAEREACAKVCDEFVKEWDVVSTEGYYGHLAEGADECVAAIRARGEKP